MSYFPHAVSSAERLVDTQLDVVGEGLPHDVPVILHAQEEDPTLGVRERHPRFLDAIERGTALPLHELPLVR